MRVEGSGPLTLNPRKPERPKTSIRMVQGTVLKIGGLVAYKEEYIFLWGGGGEGLKQIGNPKS